ncbi:hypothetical protein PHLCEN_2v2938 [Hermanssonia centrifuga]|uniref:Uncharacterized protein n=1 Tax=Hermanssonia centrifuga TaxID=98765 RepID=A0A2R6RIE0_9APHY|nr:hypothetical protein PHLCEN_2v2938 [Hermanssonia centrifuga]
MSSLSSVVSNLVRASMGTSIANNVTDDDLDRHIAELILKEAKQKAERYAKEGIRAYLPQPESNVPKTNKRFLSSIIRNTDDHNKTILRAQAQAAQEARQERLEQEKQERKVRAEEAVDAERMRRLMGRGGTQWAHNWDRSEKRNGKRRERSWDRSEEESYDKRRSVKGKGREREDEWRDERRDEHRQRGERRGERDAGRDAGRESRTRRHRSPSPTSNDDTYDDRGSHRRHRKRRRSPSAIRNDEDSSEESLRKHRRRRHTRSRSPNSRALPSRDSGEFESKRRHRRHNSPDRSRRRSVERTKANDTQEKDSNSVRSLSPNELEVSTRTSEGTQEEPSRLEPSRNGSAKAHSHSSRRQSPEPKRLLSPLGKQKSEDAQEEGVASREQQLSQHIRSKVNSESREGKGSHRVSPAHNSTRINSRASTKPEELAGAASSSSRTLLSSHSSPSPGPSPPEKPSRSRPRSRTRTKVAPPPPSSLPPPLPAHLPSKMDKYFESSYDPRFDVAPLVPPSIPATGLISDAEFAGWDAMLEVIRQRREDKEDKKRLERWGVGKDKDKDKKKSKGTESTSEAVDIMAIEYKKRGSVREWDLGKEGF